MPQRAASKAAHPDRIGTVFDVPREVKQYIDVFGLVGLGTTDLPSRN